MTSSVSGRTSPWECGRVLRLERARGRLRLLLCELVGGQFGRELFSYAAAQAVRNLLIAPRWAVSAGWRRAHRDRSGLVDRDGHPAAGPGAARASNESAGGYSAQAPMGTGLEPLRSGPKKAKGAELMAHVTAMLEAYPKDLDRFRREHHQDILEACLNPLNASGPRSPAVRVRASRANKKARVALSR